MAITRWSPVEDLGMLDQHLRRAFDRLGFVPAFVPAADVFETEDEWIIEIDAPGYEEKELDIEVVDHTLLVRGEHREAKQTEEKAFRVRERLQREFERRFVLPANADTEHVKAKFVNGVLQLHASKVATEEPRKVAIES